MKGRSVIALAAALLIACEAAGVDASDRYRSPRNPERKIRKTTELIVLHTTEAAARGSLKKLSERGECHFCVTEDGSIYRIVDRDREAFHAGRSMWNGKEDVDRFSIGIECVGYHDKAMPLAQLRAVRDLVKDLKGMYSLSDDSVVCHSNVAYGAPNKWQKKKHRGRKRCGMLFAMPSVRKVLDLKKRASSDADVKAKRLVVGDAYLAGVLYGSTDTMKKVYDFKTLEREKKHKGGKSVFARLFGAGVSAGAGASGGAAGAKKTAAAKKRTAAKPGVGTARPAGKTAGSASPKRAVRNNAAARRPSTAFKTLPTSIDELKKRGYVKLGEVTRTRTAAQIAGSKWNSADTYYTIRTKVIPGNMINPQKIEKGMTVWSRVGEK
ncbi:MAG: N-acetylmuramoyl-L-alanine amidase [Kiritimatiellae bacterium]|nr:N-acetylmuramoyl-L-alanine amidase [Kiritimatiellia bacterium]